MKIYIQETVNKEVELPKYLKPKGYHKVYIMQVDEKAFMLVKDNDFDYKYLTWPEISFCSANNIGLWLKEGFEPISEAEFKSVFLKVSLEIEKLVN